MILRRLAGAIRRQDWFTVLIEIMIVVIGVVLALQVQQWAQDRQERQTEAAYLSRLYDEVLALEATRSPLIAFRENIYSNAYSALPVVVGLEQRTLREEECFGMGFLSILSNPTSNLAILNELQTTGRLDLVQDEKLKSSIRSYLLQAARARDINEAAFRNAAPIMPNYPELLRISKTATPDTTRNTDTFICDETKMRNNLEFRNRFQWSMGGYLNHLIAIRAVQASLQDLRLTLEEVLGKSETADYD
jgi:type II secretory pathway pseudopilin PulG